MIHTLIKENKNILKQFEVDLEKIEEKFPLFRHFNTESIGLQKLKENIFLVKSSNNGFMLYYKTLPNLVINKLIHNELSYDLKRSPAYCRYDYSSGGCSKTKNCYYQVIPVGKFNLYQSNIIEDLGKDLIINLNEEFKNQLFKSKSPADLNNELLEYTKSIVDSYSTENHLYNTNEVLLDCEKYLLIKI